MLELELDVRKGILFMRLEGELNHSNFCDFSDELNYLLYQQGIHFFVLNFYELKNIDQTVFSSLQNKLIEIFLSCGKVVLCGLTDSLKKRLGFQRQVLYVNNEREAFKYLDI